MRLWHRLAWQFGATVGELQERMSAVEFARWAAWLRLEPCIEDRVDYLAGSLATMIGRVEAVQGGHPPRITGRLIDWGAEPKDDSVAMAAFLETLK